MTVDLTLSKPFGQPLGYEFSSPEGRVPIHHTRWVYGAWRALCLRSMIESSGAPLQTDDRRRAIDLLRKLRPHLLRVPSEMALAAHSPDRMPFVWAEFLVAAALQTPEIGGSLSSWISLQVKARRESAQFLGNAQPH